MDTLEQMAFIKRNDRNKLLAESDWTQTLDSQVNKEAWATYRQALRDLPQQANFPFVPMPMPPQE